ncbi:MAG: tRNA (adenosine(37)-N6)-threonylcarbamoyltransferase complex dimerization subunit type 1 TsaB [Methylophilus sp.]|uniref:tRNA (adenosine(37)-N6)-threonylcarbamoyltransferase complex dimerization subunit type 1 TsaB n=1 Tax=Methylophilus sp. TaxID=29541 RepID=UPI003F9FE9AE
MNLLAIESSTEFLSLAVQTAAGVTAFHEATGPAASQLILPEIQRLLAEAGIQLAELDGLVYGTGPGAFTGVRVAVGVTQGLAFGADLSVVGVSSVQAVAQAVWLETRAEKVIVCLDARMGEVYHAAFIRQQDGWLQVSPTMVCKPHEVPAVEGGDWLAAGAGWGVFGEVLSAQYSQQISQVRADMMPTAQAMLTIATPQFLAGDAQPAQQAAPLYIRNRVALTAAERAQGQTL